MSWYRYIPMFGRIAYVGKAWRERELTFVETLEGLEAHAEGRCVAVMRDYWKYRKLQTWEWRIIPPRFIASHMNRSTVREWLSHHDSDPQHVLGRKANGGVDVHRAADFSSPALSVTGESIISGTRPTDILPSRWNQNR